MVSKLLPLVLFLAISAFLWKGLSLDPGVLPSPLIDKPAPVFSVTTLRPGEASAAVAVPVADDAADAGSQAAADMKAEVFDSSAMAGKVWMLNIWASWCGPCIQEHPQIVKLASMRDVPIVGLNYKDDPQAARAWLNRYGDTFSDVLSDVDGSVGLDWGVYGVPETFIIDADGRVRFKHVGPVLPEDLDETLLPVLDELMGTPS